MRSGEPLGGFQLSSVAFQIVLFQKKKDSSYDEEMFILSSEAIIDELAITLITHNQKSILDFDIQVSKIDRTIKTLSKIIASFIYFTILIALIAGFAYQNLELRVSRWAEAWSLSRTDWFFRRNPLNTVIKYRRQNDEVAIELEDVIARDSESSSEATEVQEDVADDTMINPNFEEHGDIEMVELKPRSVEAESEVEDSEEEDDVADSETLLNPNYSEDVKAEASEDVPQVQDSEIESPNPDMAPESSEDTPLIEFWLYHFLSLFLSEPFHS